MANQIHLHFLRKWNLSGLSDDSKQGRYIHLLLAYLRGVSKVSLEVWEEEEEEASVNRHGIGG